MNELRILSLGESTTFGVGVGNDETYTALLEPLPAEQCPMPEGLRGSYLLDDPTVRDSRDALLLEHRDFIYSEHLPLPLDF